MQITRLDDAGPYEAPGHYDVCALRLQGFERSDAQFAWTGLSYFLPNGGCEMSASPLEKIYVVLSGQLVITLDDGSREVLNPLDSCYIPGDEMRAIRNESNTVATMLVVMPYSEVKS